MKIPISKHQFNLLTKRNAAAEAATATAKTAGVVAQMAEQSATQSREAFTDIVSCISAEAGNAPADYAGMKFGEADGAYFLELIEQS